LPTRPLGPGPDPTLAEFGGHLRCSIRVDGQTEHSDLIMQSRQRRKAAGADSEEVGTGQHRQFWAHRRDYTPPGPGDKLAGVALSLLDFAARGTGGELEEHREA
jgi:hypothetical protein